MYIILIAPYESYQNMFGMISKNSLVK